MAMEESLAGESSQVCSSLSSRFFGLVGTVAQEEGAKAQAGSGTALTTESIAIFAVAEGQVAHFKARVVFRLNTPAVDVEDLKLVLPSYNLIVYYLQACIGETSIYRLGIQHETPNSLVYSFGQQTIRSSVQFIIRGSFRYMENPSVGVVTIIFPSLIGNHHSGASGINSGRRFADEGHGRELRLEVQCLLSLPAPCLRFIGSSRNDEHRSVSPDGCRVFLRHTESHNVWSSAEFSLLCGIKTSCPNIMLHRMLEPPDEAAEDQLSQ